MVLRGRSFSLWRDASSHSASTKFLIRRATPQKERHVFEPFDRLLSVLLMEGPIEVAGEEESTERPSSRKKAREDQRTMPAELGEFVECFRRAGAGKVPKPIVRLVEWFQDNEDKMWIVRSSDNHLELTYDRPLLIRRLAERDGGVHLQTARKIVQNFERCLNSVKPKLVVLESTHGKDIKRIGFAVPEVIFGSARTVASAKVERQLSRRAKKHKTE